MLLLATPYLALLFTHGLRPLITDRRWQTVALGWLLLFSLTRHTYDERYSGPSTLVRRDHTATVVAAGTGLDKNLLVNGIGITTLVPLRSTSLPSRST